MRWWFLAGVLVGVGLLLWSALDNWVEERNARFGMPPTDWAG